MGVKMEGVNRVVTGLLAIGLLTGVAFAGEDRTREQALRHYRAGQDALNGERWELAEQEFREAVRLDPLLVAAHYGLGQVDMATKRYGEAIRAFTRCREAFHEDEASALIDQTAAERRLQDQVVVLRDNLRALQTGRVTTTNAQAAMTRLEDQISELEHRRKRVPGEPSPTPHWLSLALGSAYFRTSDFTSAEREYRAALVDKPGLGEAHNNLAVVSMLTGRLDEAQKEVALAEKAGFAVSPGLKQDIEKRRAASAAAKP
jgi:tetratricopeptide (TPR) repeat protein